MTVGKTFEGQNRDVRPPPEPGDDTVKVDAGTGPAVHQIDVEGGKPQAAQRAARMTRVALIQSLGERDVMSRRREPDRSSLPPAEIKQAEPGQSKANWDREKDGPPAVDYALNSDGTARRDDSLPGDRDPANDVHWGGK